MDNAPNPIRPRITRIDLMGTSPEMQVRANLAGSPNAGSSGREAEPSVCCVPHSAQAAAPNLLFTGACRFRSGEASG